MTRANRKSALMSFRARAIIFSLATIATIAIVLSYGRSARMEVLDAGQYTFATTTTASLTDMSSGTSTLVGPNADDVAGPVTALGFDFWFQGVRYDQFSANSNGLIRLGNTTVQTGSPYKPLAQSAIPLITPYGADQRTHITGKVHMKVTGAAPNRVLTVEWKNMQAEFTAGAAVDSTYQARLYETTGVIEFVYGNMNMSVAGAASANAKDPNIGFSSTTGSGNIGTITAPQSGAPAPTYNGATATAVANTYTAGTITVLNSAADGSRRNFTLTPTTPTAPADTGTSGITKSAMTLNWSDLATNELGYVIYRSTDGSNYTFVTQLAAGSTTSTQSGLASNTTYNWKVYAVTEGGLSTALTITQATLAGTVAAGTKSIGPTGTYLSLTAAVLDITTNGLTGGGAVNLELQAAYVSTVETFPITITNIAGPGNPIVIRPETGATARVISTSAAQAFLINGGSNVTIDGRPGGAGVVKELTIDNTSTTGTAIQYQNDAVNDAVRFCIVKGAATSATNGVITILTAAGLVTGNDNITIENNDLRDSTTTPTNIIYSLGTTVTDNRLRNSNITVTNNNIFNFFNTGATVANGINVAGGTTDWTITGNSLYQTVSRAPIAGGGFIGITISDIPGSNYTVNGNFVGGSAASAGGTAWTQSAATTHTFIGIRMSVGGRLSTLQGNTIQNIAITTSSTSTINAAISAVTGSFDIGSTTPNIIGSTASATSISWVGAGASAQLTGILAGTGTIGGAVISGNTIAGIAVSGAGTTTFRMINTQGATAAYTISGNTIGNSTGTITSSVNSVTTGILSSATGTTAVTGNTISFISGTSTGTTAQTVGVNTSSGINTITGNTIRNLSSSSTNAGTTTSAATLGITQNSTTVIVGAPGHTVSQNTINTLTNAGGAAATTVNGIHFTGTTTSGTGANVIARNFIHSLNLTSTSAAAIVNGIHASGGFSTFQNNMIRLGIDSGGADITTGTIVSGIRDSTTNTTNTNGFYHNSVYIGGAGVTAGAAATHGYVRTATGITDFKNNILVNVRSNGAATGKHYIIAINATTTFTSNFNDFFNSGGTGQVFGLVAAADQANFNANWKPTTSQDAGSIFADPQFINPTGTSFAPTAVVDLHIHPTNPTPIEAAGTLIATVTDDFDGQTRSSFTPVDIGADAGNFVALDLSPPAISYTPLGNVTSTANRSFTGVVVTDASGVNGTAGTRPRVYYKRTSDVNNTFNDNTSTTVGWKYAEANGSTSPFDFTINYALLNGPPVAAGDVIQYFVVAQDLAPTPNVGINSGAFNTTPASVNLTASAFPITGTIRSYNIAAALTGTKTVCSAGFPTCDYGSLTNTGGIFEAINNNVVTGDVTILISSNLTGETGTVALNQTAEELVAAIHSITIKPSPGGPWSVTGTGTGGVLIKLNGADGVTIDGSMSGGTDRSLTLNNPNAATGTGALFIASLGVGAGATNNTIKNCIIQTGSAGTTAIFTFDIFVGDTTGAAAGADNDNLLIQNNQLLKARTGIQAVGAVGGVLDNLQINGNLIGDPVAATSVGRNPIVVSTVNTSNITGNTIQNIGFAADTVSAIGISLTTSTLTTVNKNTIAGISATGSSIQPTGIAVATATTNLSITENTIDGITSSGSVGPQGINVGSGVTLSSVTRNKVSNITYTGTGGYGGKGIEINTLTNPSNILVANNFVSNIKGDCFGTGSFTKDTVMGIRVIGAGTGGVNIYQNTVYLGSGGFTSTQTSTASMAFYVESTVAGALNVRNNIFVNNLDNTSEAADHNYAFYSDAVAGVFTDINYNDYWVPASTAGGPQTLGFIGIARLTLTDIQTGTTKDASSQNMDPMVLSPAFSPELVSDLHLSPGSPIQGLGQPLVGIVNNDYDNDLRDSAPDIGADEIVTGRGGTIPPGTYRDGAIGGADLAADTTFTGNLTLLGLVNAGPFNLIIDCSGSVTGASSSNFVVGNVRKNYCAPALFNFPVGTFGGYRPVTADVTALGVTPSSLTIRANDGTAVASPPLNDAITLDRFWRLTEGGDLTANLVFNYMDADVDGTEANYQIIKTNGGVAVHFPDMCPTTSCVDEVGNTMTISGVSSFSDWTAAEPDAPTNVEANIAGHVVNDTGAPLAGVTMTLLDTVLVQNRTTVTDANGNYFFNAILTGRQIIVTPAKSGYAFSPQNRTFNHIGDISTVDFVGTPDSSQQTRGSDFDGDGKADLAVFRPSDASWYILLSSTNTLKSQQWGLGTDRIVPADYDGDHVVDIAVFRPSTGTWYINQSSTSTLRTVNWGLAEDVVTPADFDGDGQADIAVWRPSTGTWYVIDSHNGLTRTIQWGTTGDRPVAADYDGDGSADIAVWRPSNGIWYVMKGDGTYSYEHWGIEEDRAVVGDYDGDHKADLAVFRPSTATWYVKQSSDGSISSRGHGTAADILTPGDYDGDGKMDRAVWQLGGDWNILRSGTDTLFGQKWGMTGDIPTTSAYVR